MALMMGKPERALIAATRSGVSLPWSWSRSGRTVVRMPRSTRRRDRPVTATVSMRPRPPRRAAVPPQARDDAGSSERTRGRHSRRRHPLPCPRSLACERRKFSPSPAPGRLSRLRGCRALRAPKRRHPMQSRAPSPSQCNIATFGPLEARSVGGEAHAAQAGRRGPQAPSPAGRPGGARSRPRAPRPSRSSAICPG